MVDNLTIRKLAWVEIIRHYTMNSPQIKQVVRLYQRPELLHFSRANQFGLEQQLQRNNEVTSTHTITDVRELQLDEHGRTLQGGFRYTATSFRQLCRTVAAGAGALIRDLVGDRLSHDQRDRLADPQLACRLFNQIVELRFPLLRSYKAMRDEDSKLIEGLIGPKHFSLQNSALYEQVEEAIATERSPATYYSGVLLGRKMLLWYRSRQPFLVARIGGDEFWKFYWGYFFCNGEVRGTSARGTMAVFCKEGICLGPYKMYGDRVAHIGRDFHRRLAKMFGKIFARSLPEQRIKDAIRHMDEESLACHGLAKKELAARVKTLARSLVALNVPFRIAMQAVDDALQQGHAEEGPERDSPLAYSQERLYSTRTVFDLFVALVRSAHQMNFGRREVLEQAAWQMLSGGFSAGDVQQST